MKYSDARVRPLRNVTTNRREGQAVEKRDNTRLFVITFLNGLTLASLYFIVASGFTLVFGLMRNVNLAHGSLYLLGGYLGFFTAQFTGSWLLALAPAFAPPALVGLALPAP